MIDTPSQISAEHDKRRCLTDGRTLFHWTEHGLSFRCRHCKGIVLISWEEVLHKYAEMQSAVQVQGRAV